MKIKMEQCKTRELSVDQQSDLFFYEDRVLRAINSDYIVQAYEILNCGMMTELISKNLFPKTWISDIEIEGYSLILEHENITHWNYPYEWSFDMLKDAALTVLSVNKIANNYGYEIMDGHAFNIVFNMNKPQYIDFGSFIQKQEINHSWKSYNVFYKHFYIPLFLWSHGYSDIAKNIFLMLDYFNEKEFMQIKYSFFNEFFYKIFNNIKKISLASESQIKNKIQIKYKQSIALLINKVFRYQFSKEKLEISIQNFKTPLEISMWNSYHDSISPANNDRFVKIKEIIDDLKDASSAIELASNQGKFAEFIYENTHLKKIIATDYDKEAVNIMYLHNKSKNNFLPLLFDFVRTNGRKYDEYIYNRIKCDLVIALAVTHHLILTQNIPIEYIFKTMKKLTNNYIIIEFMPLGLYDGNLYKLPEFYNIKWFKDNFLKYFDLISDEQLEVNRHVFVGKIKKA